MVTARSVVTGFIDEVWDEGRFDRAEVYVDIRHRTGMPCGTRSASSPSMTARSSRDDTWPTCSVYERHEVGAHTLMYAAGAGLLASLVAWRRHQIAGWVALIAIGVTLLVAVQIHAGYVRNLALHVPLGVTLLGLCLTLVWASLHGICAPRPGAH